MRSLSLAITLLLVAVLCSHAVDSITAPAPVPTFTPDGRWTTGYAEDQAVLRGSGLGGTSAATRTTVQLRPAASVTAVAVAAVPRSGKGAASSEGGRAQLSSRDGERPLEPPRPSTLEATAKPTETVVVEPTPLPEPTIAVEPTRGPAPTAAPLPTNAPELAVAIEPTVAPPPTATPEPPTATPEPSPPPAPVGGSEQERGFSLGLLNEARASRGLPTLTLDSRLNASAQAHANDMAAHNYLSHVNLAGQKPWDRMRAAGASFSTASENVGRVAIGGGSNEAGIQLLHNMMMAETPPNDGHLRNILNPSFRKVGVGVAQQNGILYWVCNFTD